MPGHSDNEIEKALQGNTVKEDLCNCCLPHKNLPPPHVVVRKRFGTLAFKVVIDAVLYASELLDI